MVFSFWSNWKVNRYRYSWNKKLLNMDYFLRNNWTIWRVVPQTAIHFGTNNTKLSSDMQNLTLQNVLFLRVNIVLFYLAVYFIYLFTSTSLPWVIGNQWDRWNNKSKITPVTGTPVCRRICAGWYCHQWLAPHFPCTPLQALQQPLKFIVQKWKTKSWINNAGFIQTGGMSISFGKHI